MVNTIKKILAMALMAGIVALPLPALAQEGWPSTAAPTQDGIDRDVLYLNTIGTFSAGFVLQSYGYIGVLADALTKGIYEPKYVSSMLSETIVYLKNVNSQLLKYQQGNVFIAPGDQAFMADIMRIITSLIRSAEALSALAAAGDGDAREKHRQAFAKAMEVAKDDLEKVFKVK